MAKPRGDPEPLTPAAAPPAAELLQHKSVRHAERELAEAARMRQASGAQQTVEPLVALLYLLGRDVAPLGQIEELLDEVRSLHGREIRLTNGWLAQWASDAVARVQTSAAPGRALWNVTEIGDALAAAVASGAGQGSASGFAAALLSALEDIRKRRDWTP